jgi:hypothetical protein
VQFCPYEVTRRVGSIYVYATTRRIIPSRKIDEYFIRDFCKSFFQVIISIVLRWQRIRSQSNTR